MEFNLTNEELVYLYIHLDGYVDTLQNHLKREIKMVKGQLNLMEEVYGKEPDFDKEAFNQYAQLMRVELPKMIEERTVFIQNVRDRFKNVFDLINESDPDFVENVKNKLFKESEAVKNLIDEIKNIPGHE